MVVVYTVYTCMHIILNFLFLFLGTLFSSSLFSKTPYSRYLVFTGNDLSTAATTATATTITFTTITFTTI